jgi:hypothetical protein
MDQEKTLKLVKNLDRAAIEQKLGEVRAAAKAKGLNELANMFAGAQGAPRALLERNVDNALKWLANKPEHNGLSALLELVELNLPNLK